MVKIIRKIALIFALIISMILLVSCDSKIRNINIHGTYRSNNSMMGYEAIVDNGTIAIYSISPFERSLYWYGTCNANELDENNKLISQRLETESDRNWFFSDFGSMGRSKVRAKEILFTDNSLTFIYDMSGMAISQETLYKQVEERKGGSGFDSNAEKADPNYVEPSKPLPHEIPRGQKPTEESTEAPTEQSKETEKDFDEDTITL